MYVSFVCLVALEARLYRVGGAVLKAQQHHVPGCFSSSLTG